MRSISKFAVLLASLFLAECAMATTYYIAANGSDANSGTSKSSPWLHAPGMQGCSGTCAATTPQPGDRFILRGGDIWTASGTGAWWAFSWSGSSSNYIYIGGDPNQSYYTGAAWTRPIITGRGTWPGASALDMVDISSGRYIEFAFVELTGYYWTSASNWVGILHTSDAANIIHDNYIHGWSHAASGLDQVMGVLCSSGSGVGGTPVYRNIIDGSDTNRDSVTAMYGWSCYPIYQNYIAYVMSGLNGGFQDVHDNTFFDTCLPSYTSSHNNGLQQSASPSHAMIYNNVFDTFANASSPCVGLNQQPQPGDTVYTFNNVVANGGLSYNQACSNDYTNSAGTCFWMHNTFECGPDSSPSVTCTSTNNGSTSTLLNNHWITNVGLGCGGSGGACTWIPNPNVDQTKSAAAAEGYSYAQQYKFSPTSASGATVAASSNDSSYCTKIGSYNAAAGTACMSDTTYGVAYNTTTHTVSFPARTPVPRPSSGAWDAGAYQYSATSSTPPSPPTGLAAVVQ